MEKRISILLLGMVLCCLNNGVNCKASPRWTLSEVDKKLNLLNKPAVKTIKSEDGDIIDCVDIYKQPAFDHPSLKNHIVQMRPSFNLATQTSSAKQRPSRAVASQTWQRSGSCPNGTIPIRRIRRQDLLRAASLNDFGRKNLHNLNAENKTSNQDRLVYFNNKQESEDDLRQRSTASIYTYGYNYIGASGGINIWKPYVEKPGEYSSAQIWLKDNPDKDIEIMESGWVVNPALYGDSLTRLFAYWTVDGYNFTGCFDLICSGFVQTGASLALGAALDPISISQGEQYYININILLDPETSNWWLECNQSPIGYWPVSLFSRLKLAAQSVEWGGQVYSTNVLKTPHTMATMGSGKYAEAGLGKACHIKDIMIVDSASKAKRHPDWVGIWTDENGCYTAVNQGGNGTEPLFFFGGPGQNYNCP